MAVLLNLFFDDYGLKKQHYLGIINIIMNKRI